MKKFIFCFSLLTLLITPFTFVFAQSDHVVFLEVSELVIDDMGSSVPTPVDGKCPEEYILSDDGKSCIKPSLSTIEISPTIGVKPTVEGQGSFIITPTSGKCPDNYIVSVDGKYCIKPSLPTIEIIPTTGVKPAVDGGGEFSITPVDGECPDDYIVSDDGKECVKPAIPTIFIAPMESTKEVIFEPVTDEIIIKDKNTQQEARIDPKQGFKAVVSVEFDEDQPTEIPKNVTIEYKTGFGKIIISVKEVFASTKEPIQVKENKIFLKQKEIKIMPDTASEIAIEKLKSLDFEMELKDVSRQDVVKPVYEAVGIKEVKIFGLFKVKMKVRIEIDAETGNTSKVKKPWWSFLTR